MTSFSMEYYYPSLVVARLLYRAAALLLLLFRLLLLPVSCLWPSSDGDGAGRSDTHHHCRQGARAVRESLHVATYGEISGEEEGEATTCAVCLSEVRRGDRVWELRNCRHVFHKGCLDRWLDHDEHLTCPLCRAPLLLLQLNAATARPLAAEPSWAVERLLYLFGDDLLFAPPSYS